MKHMYRFPSTITDSYLWGEEVSCFSTSENDRQKYFTALAPVSIVNSTLNSLNLFYNKAPSIQSQMGHEKLAVYRGDIPVYPPVTRDQITT